jgi:phenylacetate-CoA ligase
MGVAQALALERWNGLLERVRTAVPFYRSSLPEHPLASLDEVAELPFTTKQDLRDAYPFGLFAVPVDRIKRLHMSSGTTGKPAITAYTEADLQLWTECMVRVLRAAGAGPGDVLQNAYGYGLFTGGLGIHMGAESVGCTVVPTSAGVTQRQVMLMCDLGTTLLGCTPSYALVLAEAVEREGMRDRLRLRAGYFGAEPWSEGMRREIEAGLGLEAYDLYGLTELGGPGVGVECGRHDGIHLFEDHFYAEVVDPETGSVLPDGEEGELVLTSFDREAAPVVRYRTRDRTLLIPEPCPCGSPFRRMARLRGRTDDMLIVRGENVFPSQIEEILLQVPGLTGNYQIVVDRQARELDRLEIRVEGEAAGGLEQLAALTAGRLRDSIGLTCEVSLLRAGSLPRSEGKARRVVDRRD